MDRKSVKQGNLGSQIVFCLFVFLCFCFFCVFLCCFFFCLSGLLYSTIWYLNNTLRLFLLAHGAPSSLSFCHPRVTVLTPLKLFLLFNA